MDIDRKECIIQVKFGLNQLVSVELEMFLPSTVLGHMTKYCNHMVSSQDENNNIKKVYWWGEKLSPPQNNFSDTHKYMCEEYHKHFHKKK